MPNYKLSFSAAGETCRGTNHENNEDNFLIGSHYKKECDTDRDSFSFTATNRCRYSLFAVFDGMGGGPYGEYASLYAAEEELRQGFFTVRGGHRIGVAGRVILKDRQITGLKAASFLNVRVAHEIKGCADQVLPFLYVNGKFVSTLIVSPPGCGKTTLLRDLIRQVSDGSSQKAGKCSFAGVNVGVADERSELGACYQGVPQNDLGMRTDVLDGCPKSEGMLMLIRSMAPAVVAVDEIGGKEDIKAVEYVRNCGCALAATAHGNSLEELKERAGFRELLEEKTFERLVFLSRKRECRGKVEVVYDSGFNRLYSGRIF